MLVVCVCVCSYVFMCGTCVWVGIYLGGGKADLKRKIMNSVLEPGKMPHTYNPSTSEAEP